MADARMKIIIEALNLATAELRELQKDLEGVDKNAKNTSSSFKEVGKTLAKVGGIAVAAGFALKKVFDFAEMGAGLSQMRESFAGLGVDMADLEAAAGGTIDEMTLMSSTAKLLAGTTGTLSEEMAAAAPRLIELARAAVKLDPTIGTVAQTYQALATGIKKNQPLLIDNANIMVKVGAANERMAEQLGKSVAELTEEEKALALLNDTLRAGDVLIQQVGGTVESQTDPYRRLGSAMKDATADAGALAHQIAGPVVTSLADQLIGVNDLTDAYGRAATNRAYLNSTYHRGHEAGELDLKQMAELHEMREQDIRTLDSMASSSHATAKETIGLGNSAEDSAAAFDDYNNALIAAEDAANGYAYEVMRAKRATEALDAATKRLALERVAERWDTLTTAMGSGIGPAIDDYLDQQDDLKQTHAELEAELVKLESGHGALVDVQQKNTLSESELELAQRQRTETMGKLNEAEEGSVSQAKLQVKYENLTDKINGATGAQTAYVDNSKRLEEVRAQLDENIAKQKELEEAHTLSTGKILMNFAQQAAAADGVITQDELDFVAALGLEYGILDEKGATALGNLSLAMDATKNGVLSADEAVGFLAGSIDRLHDKTINIGVNIQYNDPGFGGQYVDPGTGSGYGGGGASSSPVTNVNNYNSNYNTTVNTQATSGTYVQDIAQARAQLLR